MGPVRLQLVAGDRVQSVIDQFLDQLGPRKLFVEPAVEGVVVPLIGRLPLGLRQRFLGL
jgi:hypothetical protein